jgi:PAS domain S-box-containing protein
VTPADFELHYGVLPEPMLLASPAGRIYASNEAAAHLLNRTAAELAQLSMADLAADPPESVARFLARFARSGQFVPGALALKTGASETLICRIEGALIRLTENRCLLLRLQPQEDAVRRFRALNERIALLNREICDRTRAMRESALLSAIVDSSDDAIMSKDLTGIIMSWNKGAERLFGYAASEAVGRSITFIIPPERLDEEIDILQRLARGERIERMETVRITKNGVSLHVSLTISPVKDADGRIMGASKIAHDITARVAQEKALVTANEALNRANGDLEQFAYSASHDLQEPLRMVATYSEMLKKRFNGQLGEEGEEYIGYTIEGAMRMERLLKNLRVYTQVSTGEFRPEQPVDAGDVLRRTIGNLQVAIQQAAAAVTSGPLPQVLIQEFQLEQLFQNLIGNALRYRSSRQPQIHVAAKEEETEWLFSVEDNGIGIESKFKEQIFGIFMRLHTASEHPGTGMGLAICQRVVERAGGRIWVESELGRGSTFYFTLPRDQSSGNGRGHASLHDHSGGGQPGGRGAGTGGA